MLEAWKGGGAKAMRLDQFAALKLADLAANALRREPVETARGEGAVVWRGGRRLISFSCNDYLNLSTNPEIIEAAVAATRRYGVGAGASRAVTGDHPLYRNLEERLARLKGAEACLVFGSGYLANIGIIPALLGEADVVFVDEFAHACIRAGASLSRAETVVFPHNDTLALGQLMARRRPQYRHALIVTDAVFSMDGDLAPVAALAALAQAHDAWLMTDDAHGLGVVTQDSTGVDLRMGTLSKAIGGYGGYLCASAAVVALLRNRARSYVYTTGLPPGTVAAAVAALDYIAANPAHAALPLAKARRFTRALGLAEATSPIVPLILGGAGAALAASRQLEAAGFLVAAIRPPTVPPDTARLRFTFCAAHKDADIDALAACLRETVLAAA